MQRHLLVPDLAEDVDGLARRLGQRSTELVLLQARLQRRAQRVLCLEEAVRWHEPANPLVRAQVVVVREVVRETLARLAEVLRRRTLPKLRPDCFPQPLALPERLRMVRARDHVTDAFAREQALEVRLPAPGEVLAALVREHLLGLAEALDPLHQRLAHELGLLVRRKLP